MLPGWLDAPEIIVLIADWVIWDSCLIPRPRPRVFLISPLNTYPRACPLVSSLEGEMAELISNHGLGLNYRAGDLEGLCRAIETLLDHPDT